MDSATSRRVASAGVIPRSCGRTGRAGRADRRGTDSDDSRMREPARTGHARGLDTTEVGTGADAWRRFNAGWHAAFAGLAVLAAGLVAVEDGLGTRARIAALCLVAVLAGWYAVAGVRGMRREPGWPGPAYLAVAAPLTVALFALTPVGAVLLFALYPHVWIMLPPRRAIVATVAIVAAVAVAVLG